jgi:hypothetical protein
MPITITPSFPGGVVGPGIGLELASDFIGPMPDGSGYQIDITGIPDERLIWEERVPFFPGNRVYWLGTQTLEGQTTGGFSFPQPGAQVSINVSLSDGTHEVDTGQAPAVWQPTVGLGFQAATKPASSVVVSPDPRIDQILAAVVHQIAPQG